MGYKYQKDAEKLGAMGRNGDSMMMHVNPLEVQALENMYPGSITINPDTGQPEAFFWLIPALIQGIAGAAGTGLAAAGTGIGGAFGTSALGSAVGSTLAAPLTTAASALGTLGGTGGIAGSMGGLSTALGAPQGLTAALGAAPTAAVPAGTTGSLSGTLGVTGATAGKTGLAGAIETGASKLGSLAAGQVSGPADLLTAGINKGVGAVKSLAGAKAPSAGVKTAAKSAVAPPGTPTPLNPVAGPESVIKTALEPVKQGLGGDPAAALKPSLAQTKQGIASAKAQVPSVAEGPDISNMIASRGNPSIEAQALSNARVEDVARVLSPRPDPLLGSPAEAAASKMTVPKLTGGMTDATRQQLGISSKPPSQIPVRGPLRPNYATGVDPTSPAMKGLGSLDSQIKSMNKPLSMKKVPYGSQNPGIAPTNALETAQDLFTGSSGRTIAERSAALGREAFGGIKTGLGKAADFSSKNPMLVLGGGYMANQALQDDPEMPGWAKRMQSDGTGPGEIWSDDYAMQVLPTFQGMQSPQEWEDQWYVSQFNPYSNPTYMRMAGGGIVNAPRYAGGGYINPRLRRP